jgi:hypothetical protein
MKKTLCSLLILSGLFFANTLSAQEYKTALGVRLSSSPPMVSNAISLKHFLNESSAIEALFSFGDPLALGALYEIHKPFSSQGIQWFYGGGGYIGFVKTYNATKARDETEVNFGAQGVIGLDYKFVNIPLNLSLDWKPELNLIGDINFEPAAVGFTARFTFGK